MPDPRFDLAPLLQRALDLSVAYLASLPARHVGARANGGAIAERLRVPLPAGPDDQLAVIERLTRDLDLGLVASAGPALLRVRRWVRTLGLIRYGTIPQREWPLVQERLESLRVDAPMLPHSLDYLLHGGHDDRGASIWMKCPEWSAIARRWSRGVNGAIVGGLGDETTGGMRRHRW